MTLTGGGNPEGKAIVDQQISQTDPSHQFVQLLDFVSHGDIPALIASADIFVFASSVETFGITLLEGMTLGLPIACSNRSSLPETLREAGVYFDPQDDVSIADAIEQLIDNKDMRESLAAKAKALATNYSWQKCLAQTWQYVADQGAKH